MAIKLVLGLVVLAPYLFASEDFFEPEALSATSTLGMPTSTTSTIPEPTTSSTSSTTSTLLVPVTVPITPTEIPSIPWIPFTQNLTLDCGLYQATGRIRTNKNAQFIFVVMTNPGRSEIPIEGGKIEELLRRNLSTATIRFKLTSPLKIVPKSTVPIQLLEVQDTIGSTNHYQVIQSSKDCL